MKKVKLLAFVLSVAMMTESVIPSLAVNNQSKLNFEIIEEYEEENNDLSGEIREDSENENHINERKTIKNEEESELIVNESVTGEKVTLSAMEPIELDADDINAGLDIGTFDTIEAKYDSRDLGIVTQVKNQAPWDTCWAFAGISVMETSLLQQGIVDKDVDLSELHLSYFTYNTGNDVLENAGEDTIISPNENYFLENGGNLLKASQKLMNWHGAAEEQKYPYSDCSYNNLPVNIYKNKAQDIFAIAKNIYFIPTQNATVEEEKNVIKNLIKTYGSVQWSFFYNPDEYFNWNTKGYYSDYINPDKPTNHAVAIVGWDDNYSRENFQSKLRPENDGAWIVKNSYGADSKDDGYIYISYEDASLGEGNDAGVIIAGESQDYDNNYFYSNGRGVRGHEGTKKAAQIFEAKSGKKQEILKAVSLFLSSENEKYEIQIYKNPEIVDGIVLNPESGEAMYEDPVCGETGYPGLYTIDIPSVVLKKGERFSVVISFTDEDGASIFFDETTVDNGGVELVNDTEPGQGFWMTENSWEDLNEYGVSVRMNALTNDDAGRYLYFEKRTVEPANFEEVRKCRLYWRECAEAVKYEIYRSEDNKDFVKIAEVPKGTTVYQEELSVEEWDKSYNYRVNVIFEDETVVGANAGYFPTLQKPKMYEIDVVQEGGKNILSWKAFEGAEGYEIQRRLVSEYEFSTIGVLSGEQSTEYEDEIEDAKGVVYRVRAYKENQYSSWSDEKNCLGVYVDTYLEESSYGWGLERYYKVMWEDYTGALDQYWIECKKEGSNSSSVYFTEPDKNEYNISKGYGVEIGEEFLIQVKPVRNYKEVTPSPYPPVKLVWLPIAVTDVKHEYKDGTATFIWEGATDAEFIDVYKSTDKNNQGNVFKTIDLTEITSFTDSNFKPRETVYYWFYAGVINKAGEKIYSEPYFYRLMPPSNRDSVRVEAGASEVGKSEQRTITIYEIDKGTEYIYTGDVIWSAGNGEITYEVVTEDLTTRILGTDGKEILKINDREIEFTALSKDKDIDLTAQVGNVKDKVTFHIAIPLTNVGIVYEIPEYVFLNNVLKLKLKIEPENADIKDIQWNYDDTMVRLEDGEDGNVLITPIKVGKFQVNATVTDGMNSKNVQVMSETVLQPVSIEKVETLNAKNMQISWNPIYEGETYNVYRKAINEDTYQLLQTNVSQTSYIDNTVEVGVKYYYKIQRILEGEVSLLDITEERSGQTLPEKAKILHKNYHSLTIENNVMYEYAISKENNKENAEYTSDESGAEIVFDNLDENQKYYVFVRLKNNSRIYGEVTEVTIPERGYLFLSNESISLLKGAKEKITYTSSVETEEEILEWVAFYDKEKELICTKTVTENEITVFEGKDGKEICRISNNEIVATGLSNTKELYLTATNSKEMEGSCHLIVRVPAEGLYLKEITVNGENVADIKELQVGDEVKVKAVLKPENADGQEIIWKSSDEEIIRITEGENEIIFNAMMSGRCRIKATTQNGIEKNLLIQVFNPNKYLEYRVVSETENLILTDVIHQEPEKTQEGYNYIPKEFINRECELGIEKNTQQLKVYGLKKYGEINSDTVIDNAAMLYQLEEVPMEELRFVSNNTSVAKTTEDGKVIAVKEGEVLVYVYGKSSKETYGVYSVKVNGAEESAKPEYQLPKGVKLSAVASKIYLEQFGHHSNSRALLEIKDNKKNKYSPKYFEFTSSDSKVCLVDEEGNVTVNPTYQGLKNKKVTITATLRNDKFKRKVKFNVIVYGKQQISDIEIIYQNTTKDELAVTYETKGKINISIKAYGSNGNEIEAPKVKWSVSNGAVASVKANKDGSAVVTVKKPGQCDVVCTSTDTFKTSERMLLKAIDITPLLDKETLDIERKRESKDGKKLSDSFTLTSVYGTVYNGDPEVISVSLGKTSLNKEHFSVIKNIDNSYSLAVKEEIFSQFKKNSKIAITLNVAIKELKEDVSFANAEFKVLLRVVDKDPVLTVAEKGNINRFYISGENVRSKLDITTTEKIKDIRISDTEANSEFYSAFEVVKEDENWYLQLKNIGSYEKNSIKGILWIVTEGYETIEKTITVKIPVKKIILVQQSVPVVNISSMDGAETEITLLNKNTKLPLENFEIEQVNDGLTKANVWVENGKLLLKLKNEVFKDNETVSVPIKVWETDESEERISREGTEVILKAKVSSKAPKMNSKAQNVTLNLKTSLEQVEIPFTLSQVNVQINPVFDWNIYKYDNKGKEIYDDWLNVSFDKEKTSVVFKLKNQMVKEGNYKVKIYGIIRGYENVPMEIKVTVIDRMPTISVKAYGKLDLTNKTTCSIIGKLSLKDTVTQKITGVEVVGDERFGAVVKENGNVSLFVTEQGMPEGAILAQKQTLKLCVSLVGGTKVETSMQIKPVCTVPKLKEMSTKNIYKSVLGQEREFNFGELLTEGVKISSLELVDIPKAFYAQIEGDKLIVSLKESEKGLKSGIYTVKVKVTFEGASARPQMKTVKVKVVE